MSQAIVTHKSDVPGDVNNDVLVTVDEKGDYRVTLSGSDWFLRFAKAGERGLTNEILLAVVQDRLEGFQKTETACKENERASAHLAAALRELKQRTARRRAAGLEGKMAEDTSEPKHRVRVEADKLVVGDVEFDVAELKQWKNWVTVEAACKRLDPPISALELGVLEKVEGVSANGLAELKSALANTRKA